MRVHLRAAQRTHAGTSRRRQALWVWLSALLLLPPRGAPAEVSVLKSAAAYAPAREQSESGALCRAHAHNDYEHERPLLDALAMGFTSVEADVWLVNGELLVAHDWFGTSPQRTLESLYVQPLFARALANQGRIHAPWPHSIQLLIDIKTDPDRTYLAVHRLLERYRLLFTTFVDGQAHESAVTAVISGNRPWELMQRQHLRYAAYDGRSADLSQSGSATFTPLISDRWHALFDWNGEGPMPASERRRLHEHVNRAHANGQRVRFWSTPDTSPGREAVWAELVTADVDHINTDDLPALSRWLRERDPRPSMPCEMVGAESLQLDNAGRSDRARLGMGAAWTGESP